MQSYCLYKQDFQEWKDTTKSFDEIEVEVNKNVMFPGKSMEVVGDMEIKDLKKTLGG